MRCAVCHQPAPTQYIFTDVAGLDITSHDSTRKKWFLVSELENATLRYRIINNSIMYSLIDFDFLSTIKRRAFLWANPLCLFVCGIIVSYHLWNKWYKETCHKLVVWRVKGENGEVYINSSGALWLVKYNIQFRTKINWWRKLQLLVLAYLAWV